MRFVRDVDSSWERLGRTDPYWAVLTNQNYLRDNLTPAARSSFFASGEKHVEMVFDVIRRHFDPGFAPASVLDFGCGVGRIAIPFARRHARVVGMDISPAMLNEARQNAADAGVRADFVLSDDRFSRVTGNFDLVHTFIVLQHIAPGRGERILERLLGAVAPGGMAVLHLTYYIPSRRPKRVLAWTRARVPAMSAVSNFVRGRPAGTPYIPMYEYNLGKVFRMIAAVASETHAVHTDHDGRLGLLIFCRRAEPAG